MSFGVSVSTTAPILDPVAVYGAGWNTPGTATAPPNPARAAYLAQMPMAITDAEAEYLSRKTPSAAPPFPTALAVVGVAVFGGLGLWMFTGRRRNPRRRLNPILVLGGAAAGLWWLGRRAAAQVEALVPAPAAPPLEGAFD